MGEILGKIWLILPDCHPQNDALRTFVKTPEDPQDGLEGKGVDHADGAVLEQGQELGEGGDGHIPGRQTKELGNEVGKRLLY